MALIFVFFLLCCSCFAQDTPAGGDFSVQALFDFEVPVEVVEQGVYGGLEHFFATNNGAATNALDGIYRNNGWSNGWDDADWQISTNGQYKIGDSNIWVMADEIWFSGVSTGLLQSAISPPTNGVGDGANVGILPAVGLDSLSSVWSEYLETDTPTISQLVIPTPVAGDVMPNGFWVRNLTKSALQSFDGGALHQWASTVPVDGVLGWVPSAWDGTCSNFVEFVNSRTPNGLRPYVRLACVLLYWILLYRLLLKRLVLVVESCFTST